MSPGRLESPAACGDPVRPPENAAGAWATLARRVLAWLAPRPLQPLEPLPATRSRARWMARNAKDH